MFIHNKLNQERGTHHIYKNRTSRVHTRFSLPWPVHQISSLLPFTCMTERCGNNNSARVPWTKLESANILFNMRRQGKMGSLLDQENGHMRATQHFHRGLILGATRIKRKEIQRNTLKYFWSFCFSERK